MKLVGLFSPESGSFDGEDKIHVADMRTACSREIESHPAKDLAVRRAHLKQQVTLGAFSLEQRLVF